MEDELWKALYPLVLEEDKRRPRRRRVVYTDAVIVLVALWAVLHDRPISWTCRRKNWPTDLPWCDLPSEATMSRRLRTLSVRLLWSQLFWRLLQVDEHRTAPAPAPASPLPCLCRRLDSKPLPVGGFSKDRDAKWGYATGGKAKGYKLFACWGKGGVVPEALVLGPLNESDQAGAMHLIDCLGQYRQDRACGGYLLADSTHDTNPLHDYAGDRGFQLVTPRKEPGTGLGHRAHSPYRLRSIELLEGPGGPGGPGAFGRSLHALRGQIERDFGNLVGFGGGLQPLPSFVRRPGRIVTWVIAKMIVNGVRVCRKHGLTP